MDKLRARLQQQDQVMAAPIVEKKGSNKKAKLLQRRAMLSSSSTKLATLDKAAKTTPANNGASKQTKQQKKSAQTGGSGTKPANDKTKAASKKKTNKADKIEAKLAPAAKGGEGSDPAVKLSKTQKRNLRRKKMTGGDSKPAKKPGNKDKGKAGQDKKSKGGKDQATEGKANKRQKTTGGGTSDLQAGMKDKLQGAQFRWLNEKLYTIRAGDAWSMMQSEPELFDAYHQGYRKQVERWPTNPNDLFSKQIKKLGKGAVVGDFGCGEGVLGESLDCKVHSFDLVARKPHITACDISNVPLEDGVLDVAVFCLSLMGTDCFNFLKEAKRCLKEGGHLKIAEVKSRFDATTIDDFIAAVEALGFNVVARDENNKMFVVMEFKKGANKKAAKNATPIALKACIYKRR